MKRENKIKSTVNDLDNSSLEAYSQINNIILENNLSFNLYVILTTYCIVIIL